jgi:hypothetical protein
MTELNHQGVTLRGQFLVHIQANHRKGLQQGQQVENEKDIPHPCNTTSELA